ncbi:type II toxin-antitoxin system VapC family toxin [Candidatus Micrarchaeota archaeon]|nr:type II toxin-antitoxin system VapC family toxin [Candidatus Micrarchaeota archaeon]
MIVLDSFAWIEYFNGSAAGQHVQQWLLSKKPVATPATCLTEIKRKRIREGRPWQKEMKAISLLSQVIPLTEAIALRAGDVSEVHFADALVYATALHLGGTLLTGDGHFKGLPHVEFLQID